MLRSSNNKFDQSVKKALEGASVDPPAFIWNKIESQLPAATPWYSKYKYLLLLLLLTFTSASSIFVYKTIFLTKDSSKIALNKRYMRDERMKVKSESESANIGVNVTSNRKSLSVRQAGQIVNPRSNSASDLKSNASVSSFYPEENNPAQNVSVKREEKLKRYEVKSASESESAKLNKAAYDEISSNANVTSNESTQLKTGTSNSSLAINNSGTVASSEKISRKKKGKQKNITSAPIAVDQNISDATDVTQPITEPIRGSQSESMMASATPVKIQATPISSHDLMRSLLSREKLEQLDVESQSDGVNKMNPTKERIIRNMKQFKGWDINRGFHVGPLFSINNNWLSNKQYSADEKTLEIKPKMHFGKSYGVNIGFDYTNRWGVELEWQLSEQGQNYNVRENDGWHAKTVNLKYTKFPVMVKYKQIFMNNYATKPIAINVLFGPQMSFLLKTKVEEDGKPVKKPADYNKIELGLAAGFDFDLYLTRFMYMTVGARTGFGSTLRKGQPMSYQLGITTQFNFRIPKRL